MKFEMWKRNEEVYEIVVYRKYLAGRLNRKLKYYPKDVRFNEDDEVKFLFNSTDISDVQKALNLKVWPETLEQGLLIKK